MIRLPYPFHVGCRVHSKRLSYLQRRSVKLDGILVFVPRQGAHGQLEGSVADKVTIYGPGMVTGKISGMGHLKGCLLIFGGLVVFSLIPGNGILNLTGKGLVTLPEIKGSQTGKFFVTQGILNQFVIGGAILSGIGESLRGLILGQGQSLGPV